MSAFNAGTIRGSLDLDTTRFEKGFDEAHTHAETASGKIREKLESVAEVIGEALGPALAGLTQQFVSLAAAFSEGPIIGSLNAIATAAGFAREAVGEVAADFHRLGLESEKAGVSVEWMDRFSNVAGTANVGIEAVGNGLKILEERAQAAADGDKKASESFAKLGIDSVRLADLMQEPQKLFDAVQESIDAMTSATERQSSAHNLLGRAGANLIPILSMSKEEFDKLANAMDRMSGGADEHSVKISNDFEVLSAFISKAFEGIERAVAKPILEFLSAHMKQGQAVIEAVSVQIRTAISAAWDVIERRVGTPILDFLKGHMTTIVPAVVEFFGEVANAVQVTWDFIDSRVVEPILDFLHKHLTQIVPQVIALAESMKSGIEAAWAYIERVSHSLADTFDEVQNALKPLIPTFVVVRGDAEALAKIIEAAVIVAFNYLKDVFGDVHSRGTLVSDLFERLSHTGLAPAMKWLGEILKDLVKDLHYLQDEASKAIDKLMQLAGMSGPSKTAGTAELTAAQAAQELSGDGAIVGPKPDKPSPAPSTPVNAAPAQTTVVAPQSGPALAQPATATRNDPAFSAGSATESRSVTQVQAPEHHTPGSASHPSNPTAPTPAVIYTSDLMPTVAASPAPTPAPPPPIPKPRLHGVSIPSLHQDLMPGSISQWRAGGGGGGTDSIAQRGATTGGRGAEGANSAGGNGDGRMGNDAMRTSFTQLSHSLDTLSSRINSGVGGGTGGGAKAPQSPGNVTYSVTVNNTLDPHITANRLAQKILPELLKAQQRHDEAAMGQMQAQLAASRMGGGG
jgi:hypothetical protein